MRDIINLITYFNLTQEIKTVNPVRKFRPKCYLISYKYSRTLIFHVPNKLISNGVKGDYSRQLNSRANRKKTILNNQ